MGLLEFIVLLVSNPVVVVAVVGQLEWMTHKLKMQMHSIRRCSECGRSI